MRGGLAIHRANSSGRNLDTGQADRAGASVESKNCAISRAPLKRLRFMPPKIEHSHPEIVQFSFKIVVDYID